MSAFRFFSSRTRPALGPSAFFPQSFSCFFRRCSRPALGPAASSAELLSIRSDLGNKSFFPGHVSALTTPLSAHVSAPLSRSSDSLPRSRGWRLRSRSMRVASVRLQLACRRRAARDRQLGPRAAPPELARRSESWAAAASVTASCARETLRAARARAAPRRGGTRSSAATCVRD